MKKFLLFAAACVALVACNNKDNTLSNEPQGTPFAKGQKVTLTVNNSNESSQFPARKITGKDLGSEFEFKWEEGDKILVKVGEDTAHFTLKSGTISADGKSADFEGTMPAESSTYDVQYPVPTATDPLKNQTYVEGGIASGLMQFGAEGCTSSKITLQPKTAILQLNLYTTDATSGKSGAPIQLGALTKITLTYETPDKNYEDNLIIEPAVALETSAEKAKSFYMVVRTGVKYKDVTAESGENFDKSGANLNMRIFEAGTFINMPARMVHEVSLCLAAGTRITMADGSTKLVENIQEGDLLRTFDHEAGYISSAKCCMTYKGESKAQSLDLTFASGKKLSIVGTHDLLLENTRKYVSVNSGNVANYVGKRFYNADLGKWDALVSYNTGTKVDYYCIYSAKHLNCIAEGLLTCPDDVDHILNIYSLDTNLKADATQLAADIAQYGLCDIAKDFPEFAQHADQIEALGGQYLYIAIGKGLVPATYIEQMKAYWQGL